MKLGRRKAGARGALGCLGLVALAGCEGTSLLKTESLTAPVALANHSSSHSEPTHEIYLRVARGAKACWFATGKPLEKTHVFEGKLDPESEGGAAEVAVHIRTPDQPSPRGGKVFIVSITREGSGASLVVESRRIPDVLAHGMRADVARWAKTGTLECSELALTEGPVASPQALPLPAHKSAADKAKSKK